LVEAFEHLRGCAKYGLTRRQADTIVSKLAQIQAAVMAPAGIAETQ
jgi:hypothetical protein